MGTFTGVTDYVFHRAMKSADMKVLRVWIRDRHPYTPFAYIRDTDRDFAYRIREIAIRDFPYYGNPVPVLRV